MIEQETVLSVPWMPERAWTTCVSHGCISGLARANYVPFAPQPYPPGMTREMYEALPASPLRAYYTLDEASGIRYDSAGSRHLTPMNAPGSTPGQIADAASFDNTSSQYLFNPNFIPLDGADGITIAAWINVRTGAPAGATYFYNGLTFNDYIYLNTSNAGPKWIFCGAINTAGNTTSAGIELAAYDTWYFIVGKFDPATNKTYLKVDNGAWIEASVGMPSGLEIYSGSVFVGAGAHLGAAGSFSRSYMDELGVWNRVLSAEEIAERFALTRPELPGGPGIDCFPRYVMWREDLRTPDFDGGMPRIEWLRNPGWDYRNDCVVPEPPVVCEDIGWPETSPAAFETFNVGVSFTHGDPQGGSGDYLYEWRIWNGDGAVPSDVDSPIWVFAEPDPFITDAEFTANFANHGPYCNGWFRLTVTDAQNPSCPPGVYVGNWTYNCV